RRHPGREAPAAAALPRHEGPDRPIAERGDDVAGERARPFAVRRVRRPSLVRAHGGVRALAAASGPEREERRDAHRRPRLDCGSSSYDFVTLMTPEWLRGNTAGRSASMTHVENSSSFRPCGTVAPRRVPSWSIPTAMSTRSWGEFFLTRYPSTHLRTSADRLS